MLIDPRVLGVGYDLICGLLQGNLVGGAALGLLVMTTLVWSISLGSGTSGGVMEARQKQIQAENVREVSWQLGRGECP